MGSFRVLILLFSGCLGKTEEDVISTEKEMISMEKLLVSAEDFKEGENIPDEYTCEGANVSPAISWGKTPSGTKSIAVIMDDPDAPGRTFVHWVIFNIPAEKQGLPKNVEKKERLADGSVQGINDARKIGYYGPCPPPGKPHRYFFKVYALSKKLDLSAGASKTQLEKAMEGSILGQGAVMGTYGR